MAAQAPAWSSCPPLERYERKSDKKDDSDQVQKRRVISLATDRSVIQEVMRNEAQAELVEVL